MLVFIRVEYEEMPEPPYVQAFRGRYGDAALAHYSWVPQDGDPLQQIFYRRRYVEGQSSFDVDLVIWDRLEDTTVQTVINAVAFGLLSAVMADATGSFDKKRSALVKQDRRQVLARAAVDEEGKPVWYEFKGRWYKEELAFNRFQRETRGEALKTKGGSHALVQKGVKETNTEKSEPN